MINIEKAKELCKKENSDFPIGTIIDIGNKWAFCFDTDEPGIPIVTVRKEDGKIDYMTIPPLSNLDVLEKGTIIEQ